MRFLMCLCLAVGVAPAQSGWPATLDSPQGFHTVGRAMTGFAGFPRNGTEVEKARFVFQQLPTLVQRYGLKPGSGGTLSNLTIALYRAFGKDPENADSLKGLGWGNCGEWSYAMTEVLAGAGVTARPVFGDSSDSPGHSFAFTGTDTTLYVDEVTPDGKVSRRVFDAFRAVYHAGGDLDYVPNSYWLNTWSDVPLMDTDKLPKDASQPSWMKRVGKKFVKDASSETVLPTNPGRRAPVGGKNTGGDWVVYVTGGKWLHIGPMLEYDFPVSAADTIWAGRGPEKVPKAIVGGNQSFATYDEALTWVAGKLSGLKYERSPLASPKLSLKGTISGQECYVQVARSAQGGVASYGPGTYNVDAEIAALRTKNVSVPPKP